MLDAILTRIIFAALLLLGAGPMRAEAAYTVELDDFSKLEIQLLDDPMRAVDWIKVQLPSLDRKANPKRWVRAVFAYCWAQGVDSAVPLDMVQEALHLASGLQLDREWVELRTSLMPDGESEADNYSTTLAELGKIVDEARLFADKQALAFALTKYAAYMLRYKQLMESMKVLKEAQDILNASPQPSLLVFESLKTHLAIALFSQGQEDATIGVHLNIEDVLAKHGIRYRRSLNLYNLGFAYISKKEAPNLGLGEKYFAESFRLAEAIKVEGYMGWALYGLSKVKLGLNQTDEARKLVHRAQALAKKVDEAYLLGVLQKQLMETEVAAGNYAAALTYAPDPQGERMQNDKVYRNSVMRLQYKAYQGLGDAAKALKSLEQYVEKFEEIAKEKEKAEYNRAAANLGLQYEEERNAALQRENEMQSAQIHLLQKFRIISIVAISLTLLILAVLYIVRRQARQIEDKTLEIRSILDNIKVGVFSISDPQFLRIDRDRSKSLSEILGTDPDGDDTIDTLLLNRAQLDTDAASLIRSCLSAILGAPAFTFDLNEGNLPQELVVDVKGQPRVLELDWSVMLLRDKVTVQRILVSCRDATALRAYQEKAQVQRRELDIIEELLAKPHERFLQFLASTRRGLDDNRQILATLSSPEHPDRERALKTIFINLHTIKGSARSLGYKEIALLTHAAEDDLARMQGGAVPLDTTRLLSDTDRIAKIAEEYATIAHGKLNRDAAPVDRTHFVPATRLIEEIQWHLPQLARDLEKPEPGVASQGLQSVLIDPQSYSILTDALVHLVRNSMDHGIERPSERLTKGKAEAGAFTLEGRMTHAQDLLLILSDDGRGLALEKIRSIGVAKGLMASDQSCTDFEVAELIFMEGFSTAQTVTEISGRGVGMSAVRELLKGLGGSIHLELTGPAVGGYAPFRFIMQVPASQIRTLARVA